MFFFRWGQGAAKIARWIALHPARRYGVAEYLPAVLHRPMRRFLRAPALESGTFRPGSQLISPPGNPSTRVNRAGRTMIARSSD
jgi:hypothetical protein